MLLPHCTFYTAKLTNPRGLTQHRQHAEHDVEAAVMSGMRQRHVQTTNDEAEASSPSSSAAAAAVHEPSSSAAAAAANEEEALRAKALGVEALQRGDYERAVRLLGISNRLSPNNPNTRELLTSSLAGQARMDSGRESAHRTAAAAALPWSEHQAFGRFMIRVDATMDWVWQYLPSSVQGAVTRYIHPSTRKPLAYVSILILSAALYRFVLRGPPLAFGGLPGDIYYNSGNVVVSAPLLSCFLASVAFSFLFQQQAPR